MIKSIQLTNFFSFKEETIPLHENINVLIGVNGVGKTNVLKSVGLLKLLAQKEGVSTWMEQQGGFEQVYCRANDLEQFPKTIGLTFVFDAKKLSKVYEVELDAELIQYQIEIIKENRNAPYYLQEKVNAVEGVYEQIVDETTKLLKVIEKNELVQDTLSLTRPPAESALAQINNYHKAALPLLWVIQAFTRDIELYPYFDTTPNSPIRHPQAATFEHQRLLPDGRNLVQVLWHIKNNYPDPYEKILKELWRLNYNNTALQFHRTKEDQLELLFVEEELNLPTSMQQVSDGTLQNLCLLAIHFNPDRGRFICIEKPEHNLPAFGNNYVVNCMYENSYDSTTAFLFTSNKPQLINSLRVHHIITVTKFNQNISEIEIRTEEELKTFYDDDPLSIVKMWNNGEIGG